MESLSSLFSDILNAELIIAGAPILWREIVGNVFGLTCAFLGMRRNVWAWPVGIIGNALLFTVFLGGVFHTPQNLDLYGQAGRQLMFIAVSIYGWTSWLRRAHRSHDAEAAIEPRWATPKERITLVLLAVSGTVVCASIFQALGSWGPWADAWIFVGSLLATWGMAKGWNEFWLIWIGVDIVGVPLLFLGGYYPSAALYLFYGAFVTWGFFSWVRITAKEREQADAVELVAVR